MRDSCDPGGVSDGSRPAVYQTLSSLTSALVRVARVSVCVMHPVYCISYLSFSGLWLVGLGVIVFLLSFCSFYLVFRFVFYALVGAL